MKSPMITSGIALILLFCAPIVAIGPIEAIGATAPTAEVGRTAAEAGADADTDTDAATPSPSWTLDHAMEFRSISSTAISDDGKLVAYVVRTPVMDDETSEYTSHIWVASTDGGRNSQFTRGEDSCTAPAFSPDGSQLAFLSTRGSDRDDAKSQIWVIGTSGGEARKLTAAAGGVSAFGWSPDGGHLAYLARDPESDEEKADKKARRHVILVNQNHKYNHLYVTAAAHDNGAGDAEPLRLTEGALHVNGFDWSPDGERIAYSHQPDPRLNTGFLDSDIAWVSSAGGKSHDLVRRPGVDQNPRFSPDGRRIAFTTQGGRPEPVGLADLALVPADGGDITLVAHTPDRNATLLGWTRDGRGLVFSEAFRTIRGTFSVDIDIDGDGDGDGGQPVPLVPGPEPTEPDALGGARTAVAMARSSDALAFVYQSPDEPPEVWAAAAMDQAPRGISAVQKDVALPAIGKTEILHWTSPDGLEIEGLLTYPVAYDSGRVPLILHVHGGPAGVFSQTFTGSASIYTTQYFAQLGYAVLRPNPRGSTGYGRDFRYSNVRDWGYGDFEDLMAGVDHVIERGVADEDRLFLMGWSYGGYMTSFAVTRTSRFKAASMGAGLSNLVSMVHTTDISDYLAAHMGGEIWEDYETFEKHSAIYNIAKVTTPTQVIHGAEDLRVPTGQGQEFFVALERRGVPTEMIVYPRTPHGPREPKLLMDVSPRIAGWFARHGGLPVPVPEPVPVATATAATASEAGDNTAGGGP